MIAKKAPNKQPETIEAALVRVMAKEAARYCDLCGCLAEKHQTAWACPGCGSNDLMYYMEEIGPTWFLSGVLDDYLSYVRNLQTVDGEEQAEAELAERLDEEGGVFLCGHEYSRARIFKLIDPIAFRGEVMRNFRDEEFACPCCKKIELDPIFATRLDCLRDMFRAPLVVNSGYRCEAYNKRMDCQQRRSTT